jgi:hypothetical protein
MSYYLFGQDIREVGARIAIHSVPDDWYELEGPVPIILDDPESEGDSAPESCAGTIGDIVSGAFSLYSTRLCDALNDFGIELTTQPTKIFKPGIKEPVEDHNMVLGVPDADCLAEDFEELEFFEIDSEKTEGLSFFDLNHRLRIIDEKLKLHLEVIGLKGVFMVPTKEYGGKLMLNLTY